MPMRAHTDASTCEKRFSAALLAHRIHGDDLTTPILRSSACRITAYLTWAAPEDTKDLPIQSSEDHSDHAIGTKLVGRLARLTV